MRIVLSLYARDKAQRDAKWDTAADNTPVPPSRYNQNMPVKAEPTNLDPYPMLTALTSGKIKLAILVALHDTQTPMTLYQLSDATGIHYNSLRRILPQLETDGYLTADLPPEQRGRKRTNTWQLNPAGLTQAQHELSQLNSPQHN